MGLPEIRPGRVSEPTLPSDVTLEPVEPEEIEYWTPHRFTFGELQAVLAGRGPVSVETAEEERTIQAAMEEGIVPSRPVIRSRRKTERERAEEQRFEGARTFASQMVEQMRGFSPLADLSVEAGLAAGAYLGLTPKEERAAGDVISKMYEVRADRLRDRAPARAAMNERMAGAAERGVLPFLGELVDQPWKWEEMILGQGILREPVTEEEWEQYMAGGEPIEQPLLAGWAVEQYGDNPDTRRAVAHAETVTFSGYESGQQIVSRIVHGDDPTTALYGRHVDRWDPSQEDFQALANYVNAVEQWKGEEAAEEALQQVQETGYIPGESKPIPELLSALIMPEPHDFLLGSVASDLLARWIGKGAELEEATDLFTTRTAEATERVLETKGAANIAQRVGFELTPVAKASLRAQQAQVVSATATQGIESADEAQRILTALADNPGSLKHLGAVADSDGVQRVRPLYQEIAQHLDDAKWFPSLQADEFNRADFIEELDRAQLEAAKKLFEVPDEVSPVDRAVTGFKGTLNKFYLSTPGYMVNNTAGDLLTMSYEGVRFGESADDAAEYLQRINYPSLRAKGVVMAGPEREMYEGIDIPLYDKYSDLMRKVSREGKVFGKTTLLGEEPRYVYAYADFHRQAMGNLWNPTLPEDLAGRLSPEHRLAVEAALRKARGMDELRGVPEMVEAAEAGSLARVSAYLDDPTDLPAPLQAQIEEGLTGARTTDQIDDVLDDAAETVREHADRALSEAMHPPTVESQALDAIQDLTEEQMQAVRLGQQLGVSEEAARRTSDRIADVMRRGAESQRAGEEALIRAAANHPEPDDARRVIVATRSKVLGGQMDARRASDELRGEAWRAYKENPENASAIWARYTADVSDLHTGAQANVQEHLQEGAQALRRLAEGEPLDAVMREPIRETLDQVTDNYREMHRALLERAEREELFGIPLDDFETELARNRLVVDMAAEQPWRSLALNPTQRGLDVLHAAQSDVDDMARVAAYRAAQARQRIGEARRLLDAGEITEPEYTTRYQEALQEIERSWGQFWTGAPARFDHAAYQILGGGALPVTDVVEEAAERAGVELTDLSSLEPDDLRRFAGELDNLARAEELRAQEPLLRAAREAGYPYPEVDEPIKVLSEATERIEDYNHPKHALYTLAKELEEFERGDIEAVEEALRSGELSPVRAWDTLWRYKAGEVVGEVAEEAPTAARAPRRITREVTAETTAPSIEDPTRRYEFRHRIVDLDELEPSHQWRGDELVRNPDYPQELQKRLRERGASKMQVQDIAQRMQPDMLLRDVRAIDRGSPIVGSDLVVESGNGRTLAIRRAQQMAPENYERYVDELTNRLDEFGLGPEDLEGIETPVLVRERISDVDRAAFAAEANRPVTLMMSAMESALADADLIAPDRMANLQMGGTTTIDEALRAQQNKPFVESFLSKLPGTERAALVDKAGSLNAQGVERLKWAMFRRVYQGDAGERLVQEFLESADPTMLNIRQAMLDSLPQMARAEALIDAGRRDEALRLGDDIAAAVDKYRRVKADPSMTVAEYLSQPRLFGEPELTPTQRALLEFIHEQGLRRKTPFRDLLRGYAEWVEDLPEKAQAGFGGAFAPARKSKVEVLNELAERLEPEAGPLFAGVEEGIAAGGPARRAELEGRAPGVVEGEEAAVRRVAGEAAEERDRVSELRRWQTIAEQRAKLLEDVGPNLADDNPAALTAEQMAHYARWRQITGNAEAPTFSRAATVEEGRQLEALETLRERLREAWHRIQVSAENGVAPEARAALDKLVDELVSAHNEALTIAAEYARLKADDALLDYTRRYSFDTWLSRIFPYHFWYTRAAKNWAIRFAGRPSTIANYVRYKRASKRWNDERGFRERFEGAYEIPAPWLPDWMGDSILFTPERFLFPFATLAYTDWYDPGESSNAIDFLYRLTRNVGFRPYPFIELPLKMAGVVGEGERGVGTFTPQASALQGLTAVTREAGITPWAPPGGVQAEAPIRRALGIPEQELWDPYRVARTLDNLTKEDPSIRRVALRAGELQMRVMEGDLTLGEAMGMPGGIFTKKAPGQAITPAMRRTAEELGWTEEELLEAQTLLAQAVQRSGVQSGIRKLGYFGGLPGRIYPRGERMAVQEQREEAARGYSPLTGLGSREALEAYREAHPETVTGWMKSEFIPDLETEFKTWRPAEIGALTDYKEAAAEVETEYQERINDLIRERPWDTRAVSELRQEMGERKAELRRQFFGEEDEDKVYLSSVYGATPQEAAEIRRDDLLAAVSMAMPHTEDFVDPDGLVDYDAYDMARQRFLDNLVAEMAGDQTVMAMRTEFDKSERVSPEVVNEVLSDITLEDLEDYWQRNDTPLEAVQRVWMEEEYRPAWDKYHQAVDGGMETSEAYDAYIEPLGDIEADDLIPAVLREYSDRWSRQELQQAYQGVTFPPVGRATTLRKPPEERARSEAADAFWTFYNEELPPGKLASAAREHPVVQLVLDRELRGTATPEQYEMALEVLQGFKAENYDAETWGTAREWAEARRLQEQFEAMAEERWPNIDQLLNQYFELDRDERRSFRREHPEIDAYYDLRDQFGRTNPVYAYFYLQGGAPASGTSGAGRYYGGGGRYVRYGGRPSYRASIRNWTDFMMQANPDAIKQLFATWRGEGGDLSALRDLHSRIGWGSLRSWISWLLRLYNAQFEGTERIPRVQYAHWLPGVRR
jgi:hypothetical protein